MDSPSTSYSSKDPMGYSKSPTSNNGSEHENLLGSQSGFMSIPKRHEIQWPKVFNISFFILAILSLLANAIGCLFIILERPSWVGHSGDYNHLQILSPSPAQHVLNYELHRFTDLSFDSPLLQDPGDETDKAWDKLVDNGKWFAIDRDTFEKINGNLETGLRIPGDPEGRFFGMLQVNHQLHCVDTLRRSAWYNIDHYREMGQFHNKSDEQIKDHAKHCLEILRQTVQCHGDTALLTYNWVKGHTWPQSAWKSLHSCQNWDLLNEWRANNDISHLITHLERPEWVLNPNPEVVAPGYRAAAQAVNPIVCRDFQCDDASSGN